jgi:hypothetical protein
MKKLIVCILAILSFNCHPFWHAEASFENIKAAFNRDGHLWVKTNGKEEKITKELANYPYPPKWSHDGKWIVYMKEVKSPEDIQDPQYDIWVYNLKTKQHKEIFQNGGNPKWSPTENIVAFQGGGVLNVSDLDSFYNVSLGVDDYSWLPDGKGFIASSSASLRPDGWTNPILYKIPFKEDYKTNPNLQNAEKFFVIPSELSNGKASILSIGAENFKFSPDGKWISFMVSPTASWSMDSNMLCTISSEGDKFEVIDEIIWAVGDPKWAYTKNRLGYIAGGGRIVFGFKDKDLKITDLPAYQTVELTPPDYADLRFTWINHSSLIVSRVKESEWSNDPDKRPKASLYSVNLIEKIQEKITNPPKGLSDDHPEYLKTVNKISWLRHKETDYTGDLWIADRDGKNAEIWIKDISRYSIYEKQRKQTN